MPTAPIRPRRALVSIVALLATAGGLTLVTTTGAAADAEFSQHQPPPLCSQPHTGACVQQPHPTINASTTPIGIDLPTMNRDSTSTGLTQPTGYVTFTMTQGAATPGYVSRPPDWAGPNIWMLPIPGYSTTGSDGIVFTRVGSCSGTWSCTYETYDTSMAGGWYWAGNNNNLLVEQDVCPANSPNFVYGCAATGSQSAMYVPKVGDISPPVVQMAVASAGHTTKAIAVAEDPEGQPLTLTWDWGDGTVTTGALGTVASHTYADLANFVVTARATAPDGRYGADSMEAGIIPPPPVLQSIARIGSSTNGVATALLQGWPAGTKTRVFGWTGGCPADPAASLDAANVFYPGFAWTDAQDDNTVNWSISGMQPDPSGYAVLAQAYVAIDGKSYLAYGVSNCTSTVGAAAATTGATTAGASEVPVDSGSVPIGHVAVIDAGTPDAEQRLVTGHGSLILQSALTKAHASGAKVVDAGAPVPPYAEPPAPGNPAPPALPTIDKGATPSPPPAAKTAPGAPTVTRTKLKHGKLQVRFTAGPDGGSPVTRYVASCAAKGGRTRTASGTSTTLGVGKLTKGKKYACRVQAVNAVGASPWSKPGKKVKVPAARPS